MNFVEHISEDLVNETWQEVAAFTPERAHTEMTSLGNIQPNIVAFMVTFTQDIDPNVNALALYWFFNIYRMFQKSSRKPIKQVSQETIEKCYEYNENLIESLADTHDRFIDRIASIQLSAQPYVIKYVVDVLYEMPEEKEDVELSEEDTGYLFLLLKTVVESLNKTIDA